MHFYLDKINFSYKLRIHSSIKKGIEKSKEMRNAVMAVVVIVVVVVVSAGTAARPF